MALLAESLIEEWLNRKGFFTIRGLKEGVQEMDLLAVRPIEVGLERWHVEVQASFRPMNWIAPLTRKAQADLGVRSKRSKKARTPEQVYECVEEWVERKWSLPTKVARRNALCPGGDWTRVLVHGAAWIAEELALIEQQGVRLVPLQVVLKELMDRGPFTASAGGDLADLIQFYSDTKTLPVLDEPDEELDD